MSDVVKMKLKLKPKCENCKKRYPEGGECATCYDSDDDRLDDCRWCGYTHHYEDKCPNEATGKYYEKWRE